MTNEITFWPATITGTDWKGEHLHATYLHDLTVTDRINLRRAGFDLSEGDDWRITVGVDLTRPEREFTVGPYTITIT